MRDIMPSGLNSCIYRGVVVRESESVCMRERERDGMCDRGRARVCVREREGKRACVCVRENERAIEDYREANLEGYFCQRLI